MHLPSWLKTLEHVAPAVLMFTPLAPIAPIIAAAINTAEQIPGATGEQKKAYVQQIAASAVTAINTANNKTIIDPNAVSDTAGTAIDTIVGVNNMIHNAPTQTPKQ